MTPMNSKTIKTWAWVHKWSSLVCTVFMLLLCLTGLPLIFHHEIGHLLGTEVEAPEMPADTPRASLDRVLEVAKARHPDRVVQFASHSEDDGNLWFITLTPTPAPTPAPKPKPFMGRGKEGPGPYEVIKYFQQHLQLKM